MTDNSPTFQGWVHVREPISPEGTAESWPLPDCTNASAVPSGLCSFRLIPKVKTLGYCQKSLRDLQACRAHRPSQDRENYSRCCCSKHVNHQGQRCVGPFWVRDQIFGGFGRRAGLYWLNK